MSRNAMMKFKQELSSVEFLYCKDRKHDGLEFLDVPLYVDRSIREGIKLEGAPFEYVPSLDP